MKESTTKEKVLKAIRNAQIGKEYQQRINDVDMRSPLFHPFNDHIDVHFSNMFNHIGGRFIYCKNDVGFQLKAILEQNKYSSVYTNDPDLESFLTEQRINFLNYEQGLKKTEAVVTFCECLIARTGSVVMSSMMTTGRKTHIVAKTHIVLAFSDQVVSEIADVYPFLQNKYDNNMPSLITVITGSSRTNANQGKINFGVNGATDLYVLFIDS